MKITAKQYAEALLEVTDGTSGKDLEDSTKEFVGYLSETGAIGRTQQILRALDGVWKKRHGAAKIFVETAFPLEKDMRAHIQTLAPGATLYERVSPELLGGIKIRIDDRMIDGSVAGSLLRLKRALAE